MRAVLIRTSEPGIVLEAALKESKGRGAGPFGAAGRLGVPASTLESKIKTLRSTSRASSR